MTAFLKWKPFFLASSTFLSFNLGFPTFSHCSRDGVADYWYNGKMLNCLKKWGKYNSVSMMQMLPDWLWLRTGLRLGSAVRLGGVNPASPNQYLAIKEILIDIGITLKTGMKLPVFTLEPQALKAWSSLIVGKSEARSAGFVFAADFRSPAIANSETLLEEYTAKKRVERFQNLASPQAQDLACLLSAAPVITLSIVRLIRKTMLEKSQQVHVAEVFLGGLLKSLSPVDTPPEQVVYGFISEEIRDIFLEAAIPERSFDVLNEVSKYIARRLKKSLREFAALVQDPRQAKVNEGNFDLKAFAEVEAKVLKRLGGEAAKFAEELENTWKEVTEVLQTNTTIKPSNPISQENHQQLDLQLFSVEVALIVFEEEQKPLQLFNSKTVFVDQTGQIIRRESVNVYYYEESLGKDLEPLIMIAIPEGTFKMGSPKNEKDSNDNEKPQHQVNVSAFYISQTLITQAQWKAIAALPQEKKTLEAELSHFKGEDLPVEQVTWQDAIEFCTRLTRYTGRKYRLPSEAEWEYACRAGTTTPFHFGETITSELANYNAEHTYQEEAAGEYRDETIPVKSFPPNAFGLYDMHGNVWEWCLDPWHGNYKGAPKDGSVWDKDHKNDNLYQNILKNINVLINDERSHLIRGGSWSYNPTVCRSAYRANFNVYDDYVGFRVVCTPSTFLCQS